MRRAECVWGNKFSIREWRFINQLQVCDSQFFYSAVSLPCLIYQILAQGQHDGFSAVGDPQL